MALLQFSAVGAQQFSCDICPGSNVDTRADVNINLGNCLFLGTEKFCDFLLTFEGESCERLAESELFFEDECPAVADLVSRDCCDGLGDRRDFLQFLFALQQFFETLANFP